MARRRHPDVRDIAARVEATSLDANDKVVRYVLRWALRVHIGPLCDSLGLDLKGALARARDRK